MRKNSAHVFFIVGIVALSTIWAAPPTTSHDPTTQPASAARSDAPVRFSLIAQTGTAGNHDNYQWLMMQNVSKDPFYFIPDGTSEPVGMYICLIRSNGEVIHSDRVGWRVLAREKVRKLNPGEQIEFRVYVGPEIYRDLTPGLYTLHARMKVTENAQQKYGVTPIDIDQFVCHIRVPEPKPTTAPSTQPAK